MGALAFGLVRMALAVAMSVDVIPSGSALVIIANAKTFRESLH